MEERERGEKREGRKEKREKRKERGEGRRGEGGGGVEAKWEMRGDRERGKERGE